MDDFQDWADAKLPERGLFSCLSVIPKVLLAGAITLMDEAYFKLAVWLNDKGILSHRRERNNKRKNFHFANNR